MNDSQSRFWNLSCWESAHWVATTFQYLPTNEASPLIGLVFHEWQRGADLFRSWIDIYDHHDEFDDIYLGIIESHDESGFTYAVRIVADVEKDSSLGQVLRMHPSPETRHMLDGFKRGYAKHGEFMMAPVVVANEQLQFNTNFGIIKRTVHLLNLADIAPESMDYQAYRHIESQENQAKESVQALFNQLEEQVRSLNQ